MQYYCRKCLLLNKQDFCQSCGKEGLRTPDDNDCCFLCETDSMFSEMFGGILRDEYIPFSVMPSGNGIRSVFALKLENLKIYVPYEFYLKAKELLDDIHANLREEQIRDLKNNTDKLFALKDNEKKIKRILNIAKNDSIAAYCKDKVLNADRIVNKGKISSCMQGGHYLDVYKGEELYVINSATYEIIMVKRILKH